MARERLEYDVIANDRNTKRTFDGIADSADDANRSFDDLGKQSQHLDAEILRLEKSTKELVKTFRSTDDVELFKQFRKDQSQLNLLRRMKKELVEVADVAGAAGRLTSRSFMDAIGSLPSEIRGLLIIGVGGAALAAAPAIGAIVGGAVVAGIGAAGIGTGVALAFQDPRVVDAASDLGMRAKNAFVDASAGMVAPTIDALDVLGDAAADVAREMGAMWDDLAPEVVPLAEAIGDMARNAMPGLRDAIEVAKPALRILAQELPEIGDALSDMFSTISEEGDGALLGLAAMLDGVEGAIRFTGDAIAFLSSLFEKLVQGGALVTGVLEDMFGWIPLVGDKVRDNNDHLEDWQNTLARSKGPAAMAAAGARAVAGATADAGEAAEKASDRFDDLFSQWMDIDQSAIAVRDALRDVTESIKENGDAFNDGTEAGDANAQSFLRATEAAERHRQKMIASGQSIPYANQVFQETVDKLYAQAKAAGIDLGALDGLLGKYRDLADEPNIVKTVTVKWFTDVSDFFSPSVPRGTIGAMAAGGTMRPGDVSLVGEAGRPEIVSFDSLGQVRVIPVGGGGGGSSVVAASSRPVGGGGGDMVRAFETALERVLSRATLRIDDRTGRFADLLVRAG